MLIPYCCLAHRVGGLARKGWLRDSSEGQPSGVIQRSVVTTWVGKVIGRDSWSNLVSVGQNSAFAYRMGCMYERGSVQRIDVLGFDPGPKTYLVLLSVGFR